MLPKYKKVIICGCNELAVSFAEYLKGLGIAVSVTGEYWDHFGYQSEWKLELTRKRNSLVLYAERLASFDFDSDRAVKRSVSPEFECVDKIYEANVLTGKIRDTLGSVETFFDKLKEKKEIIILGTGAGEQDAYDLLMAHGIDIFSFVVDGEIHGKLLERELLNITDAMEKLSNLVFLNCNDRYGALG